MIRNGMMLTDRHMHAVHTMLQKQFSDGEGLQTTLKSQTEFAPLTMVGGYLPTAIQIHHVPGRAHRVTSRYTGGEVSVYDSMAVGSLSDSLSVQLAELYRPAIQDGILMVTMVPVQQQEGNVDSGLFSIANAYTLSVGGRPRNVDYDQGLMRSHLEQSFETGAFCFSTPNKEVQTYTHFYSSLLLLSEARML